jgi:elongation factor 1-beta
MALKSTDVSTKATALESKLQGKRFLGGDKPSADDVKEFEALLGAGNLGLFRWVKHMASFTAAERQAWGAPVKIVKAPEANAAAASKPAAAAPAPKKAAAPAPKKAAAAAADDEMDLFGEETEEELAAKEKKKADDKAKAEKKKKDAPIAKSSILMDIKPWEAETDLEALAAKLKAIERDGLVWGAHKLVPVAYGVKKLQILIIIEDDKVSGDDIEEMISQFEDDVQSQDIVAWNKI